MTKLKEFYKCGHGRRMIVIPKDTTILASYFVWKDTTGFDGDKTECFDCYYKRTHNSNKENKESENDSN